LVPDHWHRRARLAYRDDSYPERACDHCGALYRGPAVYCSLDCALADAEGGGNMTTTLQPLPGFDWNKVNWGAPDAYRTDHCSYCSLPFPEHGTEARERFIPLILTTETGCVAEFCEHCQILWFGMDWPEAPIGLGPHEPEIRGKAEWSTCEDAGCPACEGNDRAFARWAQMGAYALLARVLGARSAVGNVAQLLDERWRLLISFGQGGVHDGKARERIEAIERELGMPRCRVCGCTDDRACPGGCYWVEADLCSSCVPQARPPSPWSLK
jgi:hypothetical protein